MQSRVKVQYGDPDLFGGLYRRRDLSTLRAR